MSSESKTVFYRLVAFWSFCEAFAGGILHAFKVPFTGMMVNSLSVTSIIFIAAFAHQKRAILTATIIVAIFKLMLSPHSPPTAYIAVFFQGLLGQLLFSSNRFFTLSAVLLGGLTLVESALQRLLVLLIVYGENFWDALDALITKITGSSVVTSYSLLVAIAYIFIHLIVGVLVGYGAAKSTYKAPLWPTHYQDYFIQKNEIGTASFSKLKRKRKFKTLFVILFFILLFFYVQAWFYPNQAVIEVKGVTGILIRASLILMCWWLILKPLVQKLIKFLLNKQKEKMHHIIQEVQKFIPDMRNIFITCWRNSSGVEGSKRILFFFKIVMMNVLYSK